MRLVDGSLTCTPVRDPSQVPGACLHTCTCCRRDDDVDGRPQRWRLVQWESPYKALGTLSCLVCEPCFAVAVALSEAPEEARQEAVERQVEPDALDPWDPPNLLLLLAAFLAGSVHTPAPCSPCSPAKEILAHA